MSFYFQKLVSIQPRTSPPKCGTRALLVTFDLPGFLFYSPGIRLYLACSGLTEKVDTKWVTYATLNSEEFLRANPLKKVPAFINEDGEGIFESQVILEYVRDKYGGMIAPNQRHFELDTPEERAFVNLLCRVHDIYISSPNCTAPGFSHSQGAMYLPPYANKQVAAVRCMPDRSVRAAKIAELWKQRTWLDEKLKGPYLAGDRLSFADFTWFPTLTFMEYMLPNVFGWDLAKGTPRLEKWYADIQTTDPAFKKVRDDIYDFWTTKDKEGQFDEIRGELRDDQYKWVYP